MLQEIQKLYFLLKKNLREQFTVFKNKKIDLIFKAAMGQLIPLMNIIIMTVTLGLFDATMWGQIN